MLMTVMSLGMITFTGCEKNEAIVSGIEEKEANLILVLLKNKGIEAQKIRQATSGAAAQGAGPKFSISVPEGDTIEAISFLNQNGLPKKMGTNLLDLFAKQGLMTTEKEETIRYHAGLAQQLTNVILMIDGVIDASVQLSFPPEQTAITAANQSKEEKPKITSAVYVKHQGVIDDPNTHLEDKIRRIISGSITGLDINNVTIVSDRARLADLSIDEMPEGFYAPQEYVSIWSIVMSKTSAARFRTLFFLIMTLLIIFAVITGWLLWKLYPLLRKKEGFKSLLSPSPIQMPEKSKEEPSSQAGQPPPEG